MASMIPARNRDEAADKAADLPGLGVSQALVGALNTASSASNATAFREMDFEQLVFIACSPGE